MSHQTQPNVTGRKAAFTGEALWTKHDLAAFLNVSVSGLEKQIDRGVAAPHVRVGRMLRWVPAVAREFYSIERNALAITGT
jgi:hypothetical protein